MLADDLRNVLPGVCFFAFNQCLDRFCQRLRPSIHSFIHLSVLAQVGWCYRRYSDVRFMGGHVSPAFDFQVQHELSDSLVLSLLSTGLSSVAVGFVLIMWFDLVP